MGEAQTEFSSWPPNTIKLLISCTIWKGYSIALAQRKQNDGDARGGGVEGETKLQFVLVTARLAGTERARCESRVRFSW